jgi:hypothetical protein
VFPRAHVGVDELLDMAEAARNTSIQHPR